MPIRSSGEGVQVQFQGQKLALLARTGLAVNQDGHLTHHTGYPVITGNLSKDRKRYHRVKFTEGDDLALAVWLDKAAAQGISLQGPKFWTNLERTAYKTHATLQRHGKNRRQCFLDLIGRNNSPLPGVFNGYGSGPGYGPPPSSPRAGPLSTVGVIPIEEDVPRPPTERSEAGSGTPQPNSLPVRTTAPTQSPVENGNNSENALKKALGLQDSDELRTWLSRDWFVDAYDEYYVVAIHEWRIAMEAVELQSGTIPKAEPRSSQKFLVTRSAGALRSRTKRYTDLDANKDFWTRDDHDIRFIVRVVDAGRASGRCWERYTRGDHTEYLYETAYRLMCWLRAIARIVVANNGIGR
ncbi:MAG: hypothetical protein Q9208_004487 [Pyrenodesmia sp. 3 TL-2023]